MSNFEAYSKKSDQNLLVMGFDVYFDNFQKNWFHFQERELSFHNIISDKYNWISYIKVQLE